LSRCKPISAAKAGGESCRIQAGNVSAALTGFEPLVCIHAQREFETRMPAPAQAPECDLAFVLRANPRVSWSAEAKIVATDRTIAAYVADVDVQYLILSVCALLVWRRYASHGPCWRTNGRFTPQAAIP
jgi:hypothetical protein